MLTPTLAVLIRLMHFLSVLSSRRLVLRHYTYTSKSIGLLALVGFEDEAVGAVAVDVVGVAVVVVVVVFVCVVIDVVVVDSVLVVVVG